MTRTRTTSLATHVLRSNNRFAVLSCLRANGPLSRAALAEALQLSAPTLTNITNQLIEEGALEVATEQPASNTGYGRPRVNLQLSGQHSYVATCIMTFNGVVVEVINFAGEAVSQTSSAQVIQNLDGHHLSKLVQDLVAQAAQASDVAIEKLCISIQGVTTAEHSEILWSPVVFDDALNFPQLIEQEMGIPVFVANDAAMMAQGIHAQNGFAENSFGAVLMSYGIGLGLYREGTAFVGNSSSAAEMGHLPYIAGGAKCRCGKQGCIEAYASDYAILRRSQGLPTSELIADRVSNDDITAIYQRAEAGDQAAKAAVLDAAKALGFALASLFSIFDAFPVVFVGPAARLLPLMEPQLRLSLRENFRINRRVDVSFTVLEDDQALSLAGTKAYALTKVDRQLADQR